MKQFKVKFPTQCTFDAAGIMCEALEVPCHRDSGSMVVVVVPPTDYMEALMDTFCHFLGGRVLEEEGSHE